MTTTYTRKNLFIDSSLRQNTSESNTNFTVSLNTSYNIKLARFKKACIPLTYYNLTSSNNVLVLQFSTSGTVTVTVPVGRYNLRDLCTYIQTTVQATVATFTVGLSSQTGKVSVNDTAQNVSIGFASTIFILLGFVAVQLSNTPTVSTVTANNASPLYNTDYLTLSLQYLNGNAISINNQGNNITFLLEMDQDATNYYFGMNQMVGNIGDDAGMKNIVYDSAVTLQNFKVTLCDRNGTNLNLNGVDWWAIIELIIETKDTYQLPPPTQYVPPNDPTNPTYLQKAAPLVQQQYDMPQFPWLRM